MCVGVCVCVVIGSPFVVAGDARASLIKENGINLYFSKSTFQWIYDASTWTRAGVHAEAVGAVCATRHSLRWRAASPREKLNEIGRLSNYEIERSILYRGGGARAAPSHWVYTTCPHYVSVWGGWQKNVRTPEFAVFLYGHRQRWKMRFYWVFLFSAGFFFHATLFVCYVCVEFVRALFIFIVGAGFIIVLEAVRNVIKININKLGRCPCHALRNFDSAG